MAPLSSTEAVHDSLAQGDLLSFGRILLTGESSYHSMPWKAPGGSNHDAPNRAMICVLVFRRNRPLAGAEYTKVGHFVDNPVRPVVSVSAARPPSFIGAYCKGVLAKLPRG